MKTLGMLALAACATVAVGAQTWVHEPARSGSVFRDAAAFRDVMLTGHNQARGAFGSAPLSWDEALVGSARAYAEKLAATHRFRHSIGSRGDEPQGENLWTGTRQAYNYREMISHWMGEDRLFRAGTFPHVSRTGRYNDVAHYTQVVWPATRRVGCAIASNARFDYLVCRYAPTGNVVGQRLAHLR